MKIHLCMEVPVVNNSPVFVARDIEVIVTKAGYDGVRVTAFEEILEPIPIPDMQDFVRRQIDVFREQGLLPKKEPWEDGEEKEN